jgi:predicted aspartyl protease
MTPTWTGFLHSSGSPGLKIQIGGLLPNTAQEFDAIVDTGFSGFISMPLVKAFPLALVLLGTTNVTFGDGSSSTRITALGVSSVHSEARTGVIILEPSGRDILIGMDFLKKFGRVVIVHPNMPGIALVDEKLIDQFIAQAQAAKDAADKQIAASPEPTPATSPSESNKSN